MDLEHNSSGIEAVVKAVGTGLYTLFIPWRANSSIVEEMSQDKSETGMNVVKKWTESKSEELRYVGLASGVSAAAITGSLPWFQPNESNASIRTLWSASLLMALTAVATATQQFVALARIGAHDKGLDRIKHMLAPDGVKPAWRQLYVWQVPVMLLNFSLMMFVLILILKTLSESTEATFTALYILLVASTGIFYLLSWGILYTDTKLAMDKYK